MRNLQQLEAGCLVLPRQHSQLLAVDSLATLKQQHQHQKDYSALSQQLQLEVFLAAAQQLLSQHLEADCSATHWRNSQLREADFSETRRLSNQRLVEVCLETRRPSNQHLVVSSALELELRSPLSCKNIAIMTELVELFANLYYSGTTTTQQPASGGLFGQPQQQQQQTSAFGQTLGGLQMGQSQAPQQQQQTVPAVRVDQSSIRITTRYNDLHEQVQREIEQMDDLITGVIKRATECAAILPAHGDQLELIPDNVEFLQRKMIGVSANLDADIQTVSSVGKQVHVDAENAKLSFEAIENLKLPAQYHQAMWNSTKPTSPSAKEEPARDIVSLFDQTADEMEKTHKNNVEKMTEIEQYLRGLEGQIMRAGANIGGRGQESDDTALVVGALRDFEGGILNVANHVGDARERLNQLQQGPVFESRTNDNGKRRGVY